MVPPDGMVVGMAATGESHAPASSRIASLDGLRGIAAVVVLVHHCILVSPALAIAYLSGERATGWAAWLTYTPLHLFWAGTEAVYVFFVLSGFVLTLPFLGDGSLSQWRRYYPQRLLRLYIPVVAAVLLAYVCLVLTVRREDAAGSWWITRHVINGYGLSDMLREFTLVEPTWLNSPLWSLKYEVLFSLLLPAYLVVAMRLRKFAPLLMLGALACTGAGVALSVPMAVYLPMFAVGVLMAVRRADLMALAMRLPARVWWVVAAIAGLGLSGRWWLPVPEPAGTVVATLGASGTVFVFLGCVAVRRVTDRPVVQWLGQRSFSLYLVHEPLVVTSVFVMSGVPNLAAGLIGAVSALIVTEIFYRLVEMPSRRVAKRTGEAIGLRHSSSLPSSMS